MAALWVVILHASTFLPHLNLYRSVSDTPIIVKGYLAVDLFFVLSGFVLAMTNMRRMAENIRVEVLPFIVTRVFRLFPVHWFVLVAYIIFVFATGQLRGKSYAPGDLELTALLIQLYRPYSGNGWNPPSWSIAAELVAYCTFPLLCIIANRARQVWIVQAGIVGALTCLSVAVLLSGSQTLDHIQRLGIARCVTEFWAGGMLWRLASIRGLARPNSDAMLFTGLGVEAFVVAVPRFELLAPLGFCFVIIACYRQGYFTSLLFGNRIVYFLGLISFSIYIDHFLIYVVFDYIAGLLNIANYSLVIRVAWILIQFPVIIGAAACTWRWVERPSQSLGRKVRVHLESAPRRDAPPSPPPIGAGAT